MLVALLKMRKKQKAAAQSKFFLQSVIPKSLVKKRRFHLTQCKQQLFIRSKVCII